MKVTYDIHAHTHLSVCGSDNATAEAYVRSAKRNGIQLVGIADHMWDKAIPFTEAMRSSRSAGPDGECVLDWYRAQDCDHCREAVSEFAQVDSEGVRFIFGGEVDYAPGIGAAISEAEAEKLDFLIVPNSHTHHLMDKSWYEPYEKHGEFMLRAAMDICTGPMKRYVTSLAHPFDAVCCPYPVDFILDKIKDSQLREVFCAAKENGIAAEINASSFAAMADDAAIRNAGLYHVLEVARDCGCRFTFGSDSHTDDGQDRIGAAGHVADLLGLGEKDVELRLRER